MVQLLGDVDQWFTPGPHETTEVVRRLWNFTSLNLSCLMTALKVFWNMELFCIPCEVASTL
jgi:hypothetical protein